MIQDRRLYRLSAERANLLRVGTEAAQIAETVELLGSPPGGVSQQSGERAVVVVDAAHDGDTPEGSFDLDTVSLQLEETPTGALAIGR